MAQRRMLAKRISQSKKVNGLSLKAQIVYTWTIPWLDDYGCYTGDPEDIKTEVFPKNKKISVKDIENILGELARAGLIAWYRIGGEELVQQYQNFDSFQTFKSDRPRMSEYPQYQAGTEGITPVGNQKIPEGSLSKVKLSKGKKRKDYSPEFELFWKKFAGRWIPDDNRHEKGSKWEAFEEWEKLSVEDQRKAWAVADRPRGETVPDGCRWLKNRRFDDFPDRKAR